MHKISTDNIAEEYYSIGVNAAIHNVKTAASIKDIAKTLGRGASYTLPTLGGITGLAGGGYLGGSAGLSIAESIADHAAKQGDATAALSAILLGAPLLSGGGLGVGATVGGLTGHRLGTAAKDSLLQALRKK